MTDPRTALVGAGYDARVDTWEEWAAQVTDDPRHEWAAALAAALADGARVLELGCGMVEEAGFRIERDEVVEIVEPERPVPFQWILAQR